MLKVSTQKGEASKPAPPIPPTTHTCYVPRHPDARNPNTGQRLQDNASQQLSTILSATCSAAGNPYMGPLPVEHPPSHAQPAPPGSPVGRSKKQQYLNANEQTHEIWTLQSHTSSSFLHTDTFVSRHAPKIRKMWCLN